MKGFRVFAGNVFAFSMAGDAVYIHMSLKLIHWISEYTTGKPTGPANFFIESNDPRLK